MSALDIDTRTDIYSLGVLLYELLVGALPFEPTSLRQAAFAEIQRIIREEEPLKPSTRFSSLGDESEESARNRQTDRVSLNKQLRGDLDWITMKAIEKDRTRRYASASELADDIRRHLHYEPVLASPPSASYKIRKFVRKNRGAVGASLLVVSTLIAGLGSTVYQWQRAEDQATMAQKEARESDEAMRIILDILAGAGPSVALGRDMTVLNEILDNTARRVETELADQPELAATIHLALGQVYTELSEYDAALKHLQLALKIRKQVLPQPHLDVVLVLDELAWLMYVRGDVHVEQPLAMEREALQMLDSLKTGPPCTDQVERQRYQLLSNIGTMLWKQGELVESERHLRTALEGRLRLLGERHTDTLRTTLALGRLLNALGQHAEAQEHLSTVLANYRRILGDQHPSTLTAIVDLGALLIAQKKPAQAEPYLTEALAGYRQVLGAEHPYTLRQVLNMAHLLERLGESSQAEEHFREAVLG